MTEQEITEMLEKHYKYLAHPLTSNEKALIADIVRLQTEKTVSLDMHIKAMTYAVQEAICHYNAYIDSKGEIA